MVQGVSAVTLAEDDFNRESLGGNWTILNGGDIGITDNKLNVSELTARGVGWNVDSFSGDRTLEYDLSYYESTVPSHYIMLNSSLVSATDGYFIRAATNVLRLYAANGGSYVNFPVTTAITNDSHVAITWNTSVMGITIDSTECGYVNASDVGLDSFTGGYIQYRGYGTPGTGFFIDNFLVTDEFTPEGAGPQPAYDYYLSTSGSDSNNGTTIATAWETLDHAVPQLEANQTLWILNGTYYNQTGQIGVGIQGTPDNPIKIRAYNGTPTFVGKGITNLTNYCLYGYNGIEPTNNVIIDGITFKDYANSITYFGSYLTVSNCSILDPNNIGSTSFIRVNSTNLHIVDTYFNGSSYNTISLASARTQFNQSGSIDNVLIERITIENNRKHGMINLAGVFTNVTIRDSRFVNNNYSMIWSMDSDIDYQDTIDGLYIYNNSFIDAEERAISLFWILNGSIHDNNITSTLTGDTSIRLFNCNMDVYNNSINQDSIFQVMSNITLNNNDLHVDESEFDYNTTPRKYLISKNFLPQTYDSHVVIKDAIDTIFPVEVWEGANSKIETTDNQLMSVVMVSNEGDYEYTISDIVATPNNISLSLSNDDQNAKTRFIVTQYNYSITPITSATVTNLSDVGCTLTLDTVENVTFGELSTGNTTTFELPSGNTDILFSALDFTTNGLQILSFSPIDTTPPSTNGTEQTFTATFSETVDSAEWLIDGNHIEWDNSTLTTSYSNSTAPAGTYNVTVIATDGVTEVNQTWIWTVSEDHDNKYVAVVFAGLSFVGLYFANRFRRR
jgi:hypothetical protein